MGVAGEAAVTSGAGQLRFRDSFLNAFDQTVTQAGDTHLFIAVFRRQASGRGERNSTGNVQSPGAHGPFLPAPVKHGNRVDATFEDQRANAYRTAQFVCGHGHGVYAGHAEVQVNVAQCLHGVGVHERAVGVSELGDFRDRLQHADFVVRPHHRHHRGARAVGFEQFTSRVYPHHALLIDRKGDDGGALCFEPFCGF